jgi:hypothetical protein
MTPSNPVERLVLKTLVLTWPLYAIGALYVVGPVLAWILGGLAVLSLYLGPAIRDDMRATGPIPPVVWAWILGMTVMLISLIIGHADWGLGIAATIKSVIGWAKGWALLALFPLAGAVLPIRREILIRGQCVIGLWTLCITPILIAAYGLGLPERIFVSPLKVLGGPGPEYFTVFLYTIDPSSYTPRWQFYAPWSPFAALLGVVMVLFAVEERDAKWRSIGVAAGSIMVVASQSRMGLVALVLCTIGPRLAPLVLRGLAWQATAALMAVFAVFGQSLAAMAEQATYAFKNARADSTRVRTTLQEIAKERWQNEAFWFGHGTVQPGSHAVEYMPIGTHHTWFGLLFVKGIVGLLAFAVPFVWQASLAMTDAIKSERGRLPLGLVLVITILTFGENIEIEAYMLWPALLLFGLHARELADRDPSLGLPDPAARGPKQRPSAH